MNRAILKKVKTENYTLMIYFGVGTLEMSLVVVSGG
jgi:hypothetical protein